MLPRLQFHAWVFKAIKPRLTTTACRVQLGLLTTEPTPTVTDTTVLRPERNWRDWLLLAELAL
jgi:hypothetical protein